MPALNVSIVTNGLKYLSNKDYRFMINSNCGFYNKLNDEEYLKRKFKSELGYELNLDNPKSFNEKLQWLKLYNRDPRYTAMVDKHLVREYVKENIGEKYLIPELGVWKTPDDIDFNKMPRRFVLKCNHNSGLGMYICKEKDRIDIKKVKENLAKGLRQDYYLTGREWPYKNVDRRIIAEQYMENDTTNGLTDFKFMCFNGKCMCIFTCTDRFSNKGLKVTFYDTNWNVLPFERHYPALKDPEPRPINFELMMHLAEKLSDGIPFVRVDFYEVENKVYFGEMTFFPGSGFEEFTPKEWDYKLGEWIRLPEEKKL